MGDHIVKIKSIKHLTHDVLEIVTTKPPGFTFVPGRASRMDAWLRKERPFTFTNLPKNDSLEFAINTYAGHQDVTNELLNSKADDVLYMWCASWCSNCSILV